MTPSSRYALPTAERGTGTISAGQRWYGLRDNLMRLAQWTRKNARPQGGNPGATASDRTTLLSRQGVRIGMFIMPTPSIATPTPSVSGGGEA